MLTIEIELLTGRYLATSHNDRRRAEWPPHPARFYSALVAALHDNEPVNPMERDALLWLEMQAAPEMNVDLSLDNNHEFVGRRSVLDVFVPVNDISFIGDLETELNLAQERLALATMSQLRNVENIKLAKHAVDKEKQKLEKNINKHLMADRSPSATDLKKANVLLPERIGARQARTFPTVSPAQSTFAYQWSTEPPQPLRDALDALCQRVTRLGHSSSLVRCVITDRPVEATLVPDDDGDEVMRTVGPGQLDRLEREFARHQAVENRVLPARPKRYGRPRKPNEARPTMSSLDTDWIVFERVGKFRPMASRGTDLSRVLRDAVMGPPAKLPAAPPEEWDTRLHLHPCFLALPFVGHEHADGLIMGCAIVLPRTWTPEKRDDLSAKIANWENHNADDDGVVTLDLRPGCIGLRRVDLPSRLSTRPATWCRPSRRFATVTAIALEGDPHALRDERREIAKLAEASIVIAICDDVQRLGLPRPISVEISIAPLLAGAQPAQAFAPRGRASSRPPRIRVHAELMFDQPVRGPIIIGAGRYLGLGLCMPLPEEKT